MLLIVFIDICNTGGFKDNQHRRGTIKIGQIFTKIGIIFNEHRGEIMIVPRCSVLHCNYFIV